MAKTGKNGNLGKLPTAMKLAFVICVWYYLIPEFPGESPIVGALRLLVARIALPAFIIALFS